MRRPIAGFLVRCAVHGVCNTGKTKMTTMRTNAILIAGVTLLGPLVQAQTPSMDDLLAQTAKWQYETSRQPLQALSEAVAKAQQSPAETRALEQKFIALLKSDAT